MNLKETELVSWDRENKRPRKWHIDSGGYVRRTITKGGKSYAVLMHREIMQAKKGQIVDHTNGDKLDNRKTNLRLCTHKQNISNQKVQSKLSKSSKYKGVIWDKKKKKWLARIQINKKIIYLGWFDSELAAAEAYNAGAKTFFKEFARLNEV